MPRMNRALVRVAALTLSAAAAACGDHDGGPSLPGPGSSDFEWSGPIAQGRAIEIKGLAGDVFASLASDNEVRVFAAKRGRQSDPATVTFEVVSHAEGVTICAVYPDVAGQPPNECAPGLGGHMSNQGNDVAVTFAILVPEGVGFVGRTVAGNVSGTGLRGDASAFVVAGDVSLTTTTIAEAATVAGSIDATLGDSDPPRDLEFAAVTGNVTVRIPSGTNARIRASAVIGTVSSDFPLVQTLPGVWEATLGRGGSTLSMSTTAGSIALRRGS